jgi:hypothetical protein
VPYALVDLVARLTSRDLDHWATQKIYPSLAIYPLCYLAEAAAAAALLGPWAGLAALPLVPALGWYGLLWRERMRDAFHRVRSFVALAARPALARAVLEEGGALHAELLRARDEPSLRAGA